MYTIVPAGIVLSSQIRLFLFIHPPFLEVYANSFKLTSVSLKDFTWKLLFTYAVMPLFLPSHSHCTLTKFQFVYFSSLSLQNSNSVHIEAKGCKAHPLFSLCWKIVHALSKSIHT